MSVAKSLYYAAPLFTEAERQWNAALARQLRTALPEVELLLPQEFCTKHEAAATADRGTGRTGRPDYGAIFTSCRDHLARADFVIAVLDGPDADSGTAWEMGFAHARGIPVIGLRTDWRPAEDGASNCMLQRGCARVCASADDLILHLKGWLR